MYDGWRRAVYGGIPRSEWLAWSVARTTGLEINATHYRLQRTETFAAWRSAVPDGFRFAVKANRYLTHARRLLDPAGPIRVERDRARSLGPALGAVLWQLPAPLKRDEQRLVAFVEALTAEWPVRHAIEFRDPGWFVDPVATLLQRHNVAAVISHAGQWPMWDVVTADFVYVRLHGAPRTYASAYGPEGLRPWADRIAGWLDQGLDVHAYLDNDIDAAAPRDAQLLLALTRERDAGPSG